MNGSLLLLLLSLAVNDDLVKKIDLVDMSTRTIVSAVTAHGKTLLATASGSGRMDYILFDYRDSQAYALQDGRIRTDILSKITATMAGYAIVDRIGLFTYQVDREGRFVGVTDLEDFRGFVPDCRPVEVAPYGESRFLLTYLEQDSEILALAVVDLDKRTFETLHTMESEPHLKRSYWCWDGSRMYFVRPENGRIDLVDTENFRSLKIIRTARDPVENPYFRPAAANATLMARFLRVLMNPVYLKGGIKLEVPVYREKDKRVTDRVLAMIQDGRFRELPENRYTVGESRGLRLIFDRENGDFKLERRR
ncbi:MAG: hypothetical protein QNK37_24670 [Acidobacteriota bacterium]|nr:hypothetical protein [Acidobacteriota bacterium]